MFARRKSLDENQGILSSFVKGNKLVGEIKPSGKCTGTSKASTPNSFKKRGRPLSPQDNTIIEQNKRLHMDKNMDNNNQTGLQQVDNNPSPSTVPLNSELTELKRQIFAGFESMLAPLRKEIKELKDDQKEILDGDRLINENKITKKFAQNDEKHKKLETRLGL